MRFKLLACEVLARGVYICAARSPHIVDVELIEKGLHNTPDKLRVELQERIDHLRPGLYQAILLGYGLCGNALLGLTARNVRLIVPRTHDCIALFLGSRETYNQQFSQNPGTYYYTADYIERTSSDKDNLYVSLGTAVSTDIQAVYEQYVAKYGKDNADYLMEVMGAWSQHYSRAAFIEHEETRFLGFEQVAVDEAQRRQWTFEKILGSLRLTQQLVSGEWPEGEFLVVEPGQKIVASYDDLVLRAAEDGDA
jgi:hypothetical protein